MKEGVTKEYGESFFAWIGKQGRDICSKVYGYVEGQLKFKLESEIGVLELKDKKRLANKKEIVNRH